MPTITWSQYGWVTEVTQSWRTPGLSEEFDKKYRIEQTESTDPKTDLIVIACKNPTERVRAIVDFLTRQKIRASVIQIPAEQLINYDFEIRIRPDLPAHHALTASRILQTVIWWLEDRINGELQGDLQGIPARFHLDKPFEVGEEVIIGKHTRIPLAGDNWIVEMQQFVGQRTKVTAVSGDRDMACETVKLEADGGRYDWRTLNIVRIRK